MVDEQALCRSSTHDRSKIAVEPGENLAGHILDPQDVTGLEYLVLFVLSRSPSKANSGRCAVSSGTSE